MATLLTPTVIAKEALIALENNLVLANLVHRDYSKEYQKVGSTVIVRKPTTFSSTAVSGTVSVNTITESSVAVVLDQHLDISFYVTSQELSLSIVDFSEQCIMPAMRAHAQKVDSLIAALADQAAGHYPVSATPAVSDIAGIEAVLDVNKAPLTDRRLVLHPITKSAYMSLDSFLHASKRGDGGTAMKKAELGQVLGFDTFMDQNVITHTSGAMADLVGAMKGAGVAAATIATIDAVTSGGTVLAGDVFKVTGYDEWFRVAANATASAATLTISFSPAFKGAIADDAVVTFQGTGKSNMAFHKNAFALVMAPLAPPIGGAAASVLNYKGLSCRVVYDYAIMEKKNIISIDLLCGVKTLDKDLAARLEDTR